MNGKNAVSDSPPEICMGYEFGGVGQHMVIMPTPLSMSNMPMELTVLGLVPSMKRVLPCAVRKHVTNRRIQ